MTTTVEKTGATTSQVTVTTLRRMKANGEKIAMLTAYDASFAAQLDAAGVDVVLVGDSLGMVIQGHQTTVPVTIDDMIYHTACVAGSAGRMLVMADMPFMSFRDVDHALDNATRLMQEGGAHMVKLEGGGPVLPVVNALAQHGIPVCGHIGLQPQSIHKLGGYRVQGREQQTAETMRVDARAMQDAGADLVLMECVPAALAAETITLSYNDADQVRAAFAETGDQIAAIIVEPVAGNMNCVPPLPGFLETLRSVCDEHGSVLIFDEVMTGFRVALGGAQALFDIRPDLTTLGKVIGGGMPVGAFGGRADIMDHIAPTGPVYQAGTLSGNPVAMAAGIATLEILSRPGTYRKLERLGAELERGTAENLRKTGVRAVQNRVGSISCLFLKLLFSLAPL